MYILIVLVAGLSSDWETENGERRTLSLPGRVDELIERDLDANRNTVIVTQSGMPSTMPWAHKASTIAYAWLGGQEPGHDITDVLFGRINPHARMPLTFPKRLQDNPAYLTFGKADYKLVYGEGIFVGYRYYEQLETEPLWYFGHGLSYTRFAYSNLAVPEDYASDPNHKMEISLDMQNTGQLRGAEIVQIYDADPDSSFQRPKKELKAFQKVALEPNQKCTVKIVLDKYALSATGIRSQAGLLFIMNIVKEKVSASEVEHHEATADHALHKSDIITDAAIRGQGISGYESLTVWQTVRKFKLNGIYCFLVTLSAATDGCQIGLLGNIIANKGFIDKFGAERNADGSAALASSILSAWSAIGSVGQIIGMTSLAFFSNRFGRKAVMYCYWLLLAISIALECVSPDWKVWLVAKLFGGISVGCMQSTIPTYISEVAPVRVRGAFLMCYGLWWITGQFFAPVAMQVMSSNDPGNYLTPVYTQWSQIGLMLIIYLIIQESPAWQASRGNAEKAKKTLRQIYRGVEDFDVDHQYKLLVINIEHERAIAAEQRSEKWYAIFKGRDGLRTVISCWTLMTQQFIGLGVFFGYGTYFFQQAGVQDPFRVTCITSGINIAASLVVIYLADAVGRRWMACTGTTLWWVCNIAVGILGVVPKVKASEILLVFFACLWNIGLVANGATGWGFIGEISSQRLRPYTVGFAAASTCAVGVVMGVLIPYMVNQNQWKWGLKTCWFFAGLGLPFTIAMWFLIPETSGRSSAELDELFERKIKPWNFHKTVTATERIVKGREEEA